MLYRDSHFVKRYSQINITQFQNFEFLPRLRSRPKLLFETFQTEIISNQTFKTEIKIDQNLQTQITCDQTFLTQRVSDLTFQTEGVLIRTSSDHGPDSISDHCADLNQTMIRALEEVMIRPSCARIIYGQKKLRCSHLWPD